MQPLVVTIAVIIILLSYFAKGKENSTKLLSNQSSKDIFSATVRKFNIRPAPVKSGKTLNIIFEELNASLIDGSHSNFLPAIVMVRN